MRPIPFAAYFNIEPDVIAIAPDGVFWVHPSGANVSNPQAIGTSVGEVVRSELETIIKQAANLAKS